MYIGGRRRGQERQQRVHWGGGEAWPGATAAGTLGGGGVARGCSSGYIGREEAWPGAAAEGTLGCGAWSGAEAAGTWGEREKKATLK